MATNDDRGVRHRHRHQYGHNRIIVPITDLAFGERGVIAFIKGDKKSSPAAFRPWAYREYGGRNAP